MIETILLVVGLLTLTIILSFSVLVIVAFIADCFNLPIALKLGIVIDKIFI